MSRLPRQASGFSLLETVVALLILSMSLGMLYQATAGATRNVRVDERYAYAVMLAESLLNEHRSVPVGGIAQAESRDDYRWEVVTRPASYGGGDGALQDALPLHEVSVNVFWQDGDNVRSVTLVSVVPEAEQLPEQPDA